MAAFIRRAAPGRCESFVKHNDCVYLGLTILMQNKGLRPFWAMFCNGSNSFRLQMSAWLQMAVRCSQMTLPKYVPGGLVLVLLDLCSPALRNAELCAFTERLLFGRLLHCDAADFPPCDILFEYALLAF